MAYVVSTSPPQRNTVCGADRIDDDGLDLVLRGVEGLIADPPARH